MCLNVLRFHQPEAMLSLRVQVTGLEPSRVGGPLKAKDI